NLPRGYPKRPFRSSSTLRLGPRALPVGLHYIPAPVVHCRVFAKDHTHNAVLSEVVEKALLVEGSSIKTNV
ncbi:MAG TPA: hypothetical protein VJM77_05575, partial [Nitrospiria bacterium]|nr:hypothetical protein [Nitrospiria bacterium]